MVITTSVHNATFIFIEMRRWGDEEMEAIESLISSSQTSVEKLITNGASLLQTIQQA
jgi:hypothetical protein